MIAKDERRRPARCRVPLGILAVLTATILVQQASAATQEYFDTNGTTSGIGSWANNGSFSWDGTNWQIGSSTGSTISTWVNDGTGFARFYQGGGTSTSQKNVTVNVGQAENMAGLYLNGSYETLTIGTSSLSGALNVSAGLQGFLTGNNSANGTGVVINAPITGATGGILQQSSGGLSLYGVNTFGGGFGTTGGQVTNYNNNSSFGTGSIQWSGSNGSIQGVVKNGAAAVTISNDVYFEPINKDLGIVANDTPNTGINFVTNGSAAAPGTTWSGNWHLPVTQSYNVGTVTYNTTGVATIETGTSSSFSQISGVISGDSNTNLCIGSATAAQTAGGNAGMLILSGANTYTGTTTVFGGTVKLGVANTLASNSLIDLNGGTLDSGGFVHVMSSTDLDIFGATSTATVTTINTSSGGQISFSENTNIENWGEFESGILNVVGPLATLRFGTDTSGLRSDQLAMIEFNGDSSSLGTGFLTNDGYLVPEPSSLAFAFIGAPLLLRRRRRRVA